MYIYIFINVKRNTINKIKIADWINEIKMSITKERLPSKNN